MNPSATMSRCRSGSRTTLSASRTLAWSTCIWLKNIVHSAIVPEPPPNRGVMIVLAYLWPLALVPLLLDKSDPEVQWHARHGIVLMVAELVLLFAYIMLTSLVSLATFGLGCALSLLLVFGWIARTRRPHRRHGQRHQRRSAVLPFVSEYASRF